MRAAARTLKDERVSLKLSMIFQNLKSWQAYKDFFLEFIGIDAQ